MKREKKEKDTSVSVENGKLGRITATDKITSNNAAERFLSVFSHICTKAENCFLENFIILSLMLETIKYLS